MDHILISMWKRLRMWRARARRLTKLVKVLTSESIFFQTQHAMLQRKVQRLEEVKHRYEQIVKEIRYINKYSSMLEANELQVGEKLPPSLNINRNDHLMCMEPWDNSDIPISTQVHYETLERLRLQVNRDFINQRIHIVLRSRFGVAAYYATEEALKYRHDNKFPHSFMEHAMRELTRYWVKEYGPK